MLVLVSQKNNPMLRSVKDMVRFSLLLLPDCRKSNEAITQHAALTANPILCSSLLLLSAGRLYSLMTEQ